MNVHARVGAPGALEVAAQVSPDPDVVHDLEGLGVLGAEPRAEDRHRFGVQRLGLGGTQFVFSRMANIEFELGALTTF